MWVPLFYVVSQEMRHMNFFWGGGLKWGVLGWKSLCAFFRSLSDSEERGFQHQYPLPSAFLLALNLPGLEASQLCISLSRTTAFEHAGPCVPSHNLWSCRGKRTHRRGHAHLERADLLQMAMEQHGWRHTTWTTTNSFVSFRATPPENSPTQIRVICKHAWSYLHK